ncbi:hypothetical protein IAD21_00608 [Abditibacteriota bacterium]|nr:hypothetical protein IAD21_00608 [Abditibacteriota bacterium]
MNAIQLLTTKKRPSGWWQCQAERCGLLHHSQDAAECCCRCSVCGQPIERGKFRHPECQKQIDVQALADRIQKAEKLTTWDSWVFWDGWGHKEGYFESLDDLKNHAEWKGLELPEWVFVTEQQPFNSASIDDIRDRIESDGYEDVWADCEGVSELEKAIETFNDLNAGLVSYTVDYKRVVSTRGVT